MRFSAILIATCVSSCAAVRPQQAASQPVAHWLLLPASQPAPEPLFCLTRAGAEQAHAASLSCQEAAAIAEEDAKEARAQDHKDALIVRFGLPSVGILGIIIGGALGIAAAHH